MACNAEEKLNVTDDETSATGQDEENQLILSEDENKMAQREQKIPVKPFRLKVSLLYLVVAYLSCNIPLTNTMNPGFCLHGMFYLILIRTWELCLDISSFL